MNKKILVGAMALAVSVLVAGCGAATKPEEKKDATTPTQAQDSSNPAATTDKPAAATDEKAAEKKDEQPKADEQKPENK